MDKILVTKVRKFANDEGPPGQRAWEELVAYPRQELISSLTRIQEATPADDTLRTDIAFVFCNLDHEYQANRRVITDAFKKTSRDAFGEERLISRLIRRGDTDMLPFLFAAAQWSDGAISAGLSDTFAEQMRGDPETFLRTLKAEPPGTRRKVYELLNATVLSEEDVTEIKRYLKSVSEEADTAPVAREMLKHLSGGGSTMIRHNAKADTPSGF